MHNKSWFFCFLLILFGFFHSSDLLAQNNYPQCAIDGSPWANPIVGCQDPLYQLWKFQFINYDQLPSNWISYVRTFNDFKLAAIPNKSAEYPSQPSYQANFCSFQCFVTETKFSYAPPDSNLGLVAYIQDTYTTGSSGGGYDVIYANLVAICPIHTTHQLDFNASGTEQRWVCIPDYSLKGPIDLPEASDVTNTEGQCPTCNPVNLGSLQKQDDEVDLLNHSPYPIIWSRHWSGRSKDWIYNYDRSLEGITNIANQGLNLTTAIISLKRQDGQHFLFNGTKNGHVWVWTPHFSNPSFNNMMLGKLTSDEALSTFSFINHLDETEVYNSQGQLVSLADVRNLPLLFTYDVSGRLVHIKDASNRTLDISYANLSTSSVSHSVDSQGVITNTNFDGYSDSTFANLPLEKLPEIVTDGNHAIGYVYTLNSADTTTYNPTVLTQIIKPDNTTITYHYDNKGQFTGITDEKGDRYTTYVYLIPHVTHPRLRVGKSGAVFARQRR